MAGRSCGARDAAGRGGAVLLCGAHAVAEALVAAVHLDAAERARVEQLVHHQLHVPPSALRVILNALPLGSKLPQKARLPFSLMKAIDVFMIAKRYCKNHYMYASNSHSPLAFRGKAALTKVVCGCIGGWR